MDGIDFDVAPGESFGFLGPNGAAKTSTMRMVACVSPVTEGTLRILDLDPATDGARIRARLGVVPQQDTLAAVRRMRRRLTIARALINEPSILLLHEPTTGLDPQARHLPWERLHRLKQRGVISGTFYPISAYPEPLRLLVQVTLLYQGVDLVRALVTGAVDPAVLWHVAYLSAMGLAGLLVVSRRLDRLLPK